MLDWSIILFRDERVNQNIVCFQSSSARESTPEPRIPDQRVMDPPPQPKPKKSRSKSRNLEPLTMPSQLDDDPNADDFELTSKSRAYKKIKGQMEVYGGDKLKAR